jgi:hypothetical protein
MSMAAKTSPGKRWQKPAALRPGDAVAVIAPSGPVPSERLEAGLAVLRERYRVVQSDGLLDSGGFWRGRMVDAWQSCAGRCRTRSFGRCSVREAGMGCCG